MSLCVCVCVFVCVGLFPECVCVWEQLCLLGDSVCRLSAYRLRANAVPHLVDDKRVLPVLALLGRGFAHCRRAPAPGRGGVRHVLCVVRAWCGLQPAVGFGVSRFFGLFRNSTKY